MGTILLPANDLRSDQRGTGSAVLDPGMFQDALGRQSPRGILHQQTLDQILRFLRYHAPFTLGKLV